jgi:hypothetical protein
MGEYYMDSKLARAAKLMTLADLDAHLASADGWANDFLLELYQLRAEDTPPKGRAGGDLNGPVKLVMLAGLPSQLRHEIVEKVTGFPPFERLTTLAEKYNTATRAEET